MSFYKCLILYMGRAKNPRRFYRIGILHDFPDFMGIHYYTAISRNVAVCKTL